MSTYHPPSIDSLLPLNFGASFLQIPPLTQLKSGDDRNAIFLAHGLGGSVLEFIELAKHIRSSRPVYGVQAKGSDGASEPLGTIEEMAGYHLEAIKRVQPRGPYFLAGHSLGGLVALEVARRVAEHCGDSVTLVMIDSYPHFRYLAAGKKARLVARLAARKVLGVREGATGIHRKKTTEVPQTRPAMARVREYGYLALERYQPRFYDGKIRFVRAAIPSVFPDDPAAIWRQFTREFVLETVPGDHFGVLTTHADALAAVLSRYCDEVAS